MSHSVFRETAESVEEEYFRSREKRQESDPEDGDDQSLTVYQTKDIINFMNLYTGIAMTTLESKCGLFRVRKTYSIQTKGVNPYNNSFELLTP